MAVDRSTLRPGDVICTRNSAVKDWRLWRWVFAFFIRLGAALRDMPNTGNHVIIVHHWDPAEDAAGNPVPEHRRKLWGYEGRPGGFGIVEITERMCRSPYVVSNAEQPKDDAGRYRVAVAMEQIVGTPYDWGGIAIAGFEAVGIDIWDQQWGPEMPGHIFCSAAADWLYDREGWASPGLLFDRTITPGEWIDFIARKAWALAA